MMRPARRRRCRGEGRDVSAGPQLGPETRRRDGGHGRDLPCRSGGAPCRGPRPPLQETERTTLRAGSIVSSICTAVWTGARRALPPANRRPSSTDRFSLPSGTGPWHRPSRTIRLAKSAEISKSESEGHEAAFYVKRRFCGAGWFAGKEQARAAARPDRTTSCPWYSGSPAKVPFIDRHRVGVPMIECDIIR